MKFRRQTVQWSWQGEGQHQSHFVKACTESTMHDKYNQVGKVAQWRLEKMSRTEEKVTKPGFLISSQSHVAQNLLFVPGIWTAQLMTLYYSLHLPSTAGENLPLCHRCPFPLPLSLQLIAALGPWCKIDDFPGKKNFSIISIVEEE